MKVERSKTEAEVLLFAPERLDFVAARGSLVATRGALARYQPSRNGPIVQHLDEGKRYLVADFTDQGEMIADSARWFCLQRRVAGGST